MAASTRVGRSSTRALSTGTIGLPGSLAGRAGGLDDDPLSPGNGSRYGEIGSRYGKIGSRYGSRRYPAWRPGQASSAVPPVVNPFFSELAALAAMRAFVAPSILLSIARRSPCRGFTQGLCSATTDRPTAAVPCAVMAPVGNTTARAAASSPGSWPLGLDPENCKVVEIRQQLRQRCGTSHTVDAFSCSCQL